MVVKAAVPAAQASAITAPRAPRSGQRKSRMARKTKIAVAAQKGRPWPTSPTGSRLAGRVGTQVASSAPRPEPRAGQRARRPHQYPTTDSTTPCVSSASLSTRLHRPRDQDHHRSDGKNTIEIEGSANKGNARHSGGEPRERAFQSVGHTRPGESRDLTINDAFDSAAHPRWAVQERSIENARHEPGGSSIGISTSHSARSYYRYNRT